MTQQRPREATGCLKGTLSECVLESMSWPRSSVLPRDGASIVEADTLDGVIELAKNAPPGRYRIDKVSWDPATGNLRSWNLGVIIKDRKGI